MEYPDTLMIEVTQEDIDNGRCKNPFDCMIALATLRKAKEMELPLLRYDTAFVDSEDAAVAVSPGVRTITLYSAQWPFFVGYTIPEDVAEVAQRFDMGHRDMQPFVFTARRVEPDGK